MRIIDGVNRALSKIIKDDSIVDKIVQGSFWIVLGGIFSKIISLVGTILLARLLGVSDYGKLGVVIGTVGSFSMFAGAGMGLTATKYVAFYNTQKDTSQRNEIMRLVLITALLFGAIFSVLLMLTSKIVSVHLFSNESLTLPLVFIAPSLLFISLNGAIQGVFLGLQNFKQVSLFQIFYGLINYPLIVGLAVIKGVEGGAIGFTISTFLNTVVMFYWLKKSMVPETKKLNYVDLVKKYKTIILHYSFPAIFGGALVAPVLWVADILVANSNGGFESLGFFQSGNRIKEMIIFVPSVLSSMILPLLASVTDKKDVFKGVLKVNMGINLLLSIIIATPIIFFSKFIMSLFGPEFEPHWLVLVIMALTSILITYNSVIGKVIASNGNMWLGFLFNSIWGVVIISSVFVLVRLYDYGSEGYAMAFFVAYLVHSIVQTIYIKNYQNKV